MMQINANDLDCIIRLIKLVRENKFLFDKNQTGYNNLYLKEKAWKEIAKVLDRDEDSCRRKWKTLRDSYFREVKKNEKKSGSAAMDSLSKWKFFKHLDFLNVVQQQRNNAEITGEIINAGENIDIGDEPEGSTTTSSPQSPKDYSSIQNDHNYCALYNAEIINPGENIDIGDEVYLPEGSTTTSSPQSPKDYSSIQNDKNYCELYNFEFIGEIINPAENSDIDD